MIPPDERGELEIPPSNSIGGCHDLAHYTLQRFIAGVAASGKGHQPWRRSGLDPIPSVVHDPLNIAFQIEALTNSDGAECFTLNTIPQPNLLMTVETPPKSMKELRSFGSA